MKYRTPVKTVVKAYPYYGSHVLRRGCRETSSHHRAASHIVPRNFGSGMAARDNVGTPTRPPTTAVESVTPYRTPDC